MDGVKSGRCDQPLNQFICNWRSVLRIPWSQLAKYLGMLALVISQTRAPITPTFPSDSNREITGDCVEK